MRKINLSQFARTFQAYLNCKKTGNTEWEHAHMDVLNGMCELLPHGSGLDGKMEFQPENSHPEKLCFFFEFHHIDENGYYCGWTEHNLFVTPSLQYGFELRITGRNKNDIKDYLYDLFHEVFSLT
jgi:hypothetical protein